MLRSSRDSGPYQRQTYGGDRYDPRNQYPDPRYKYPSPATTVTSRAGQDSEKEPTTAPSRNVRAIPDRVAQVPSTTSVEREKRKDHRERSPAEYQRPRNEHVRRSSSVLAEPGTPHPLAASCSSQLRALPSQSYGPTPRNDNNLALQHQSGSGVRGRTSGPHSADTKAPEEERPGRRREDDGRVTSGPCCRSRICAHTDSSVPPPGNSEYRRTAADPPQTALNKPRDLHRLQQISDWRQSTAAVGALGLESLSTLRDEIKAFADTLFQIRCEDILSLDESDTSSSVSVEDSFDEYDDDGEQLLSFEGLTNIPSSHTSQCNTGGPGASGCASTPLQNSSAGSDGRASQQSGSKRPNSSRDSEDQQDDDSASKRPRTFTDSPEFASRTLQIPCIIEGCPGRNGSPAELE
jgi:hypothetical protein